MSAIDKLKEAEAAISIISVLGKMGGASLAIGGIGIALTAVVAAVTAYKTHMENLRKEAEAGASTFQQSRDSLDEYVSKIQELKGALDDGSLTEAEAYDAKKQLLDIQTQLNGSYGDAASGIDLVNGKLDEQIAKVRELSALDANRFLNEQASGIRVAEREITKTLGGEGNFFREPGEYIGMFYENAEDSTEKLKEILRKYSNFETDDMGDGSVRVRFVGDATQAKSVLNDFMTDMREAEKEFGDASIFQDLFDGASIVYKEADSIIANYEGIYKEAMRARMVAESSMTDPITYSGGGQNKTSAEWLDDYTSSIQAYNDALNSGDTSEIAAARSEFESLDATINSLLNDSDGFSYFAPMFSEVRNALNKSAASAEKFKESMAVDKNADSLKRSGMTQTQFASVFVDGLKSDQSSEAIRSILEQYAEIYGTEFGDITVEQVEMIAGYLADIGVLVCDTVSDAVTTSLRDVKKAADDTTATISNISNVQKILASQGTGVSLSVEDFTSDDIKEYASAMEYVNGAYQLNAEKVSELVKAKSELVIRQNEENKALAQTEYLKNAKQIDKYRKELEKARSANSGNVKTIEQSIAALRKKNIELRNECKQYDLMNAALIEATSAYQHWINAQSASQTGDMFDGALKAIQHIDDTLNNAESDLYGRIGRTDYKAAVDFIIPDTVDKADTAAVNAYLSKIRSMFTFDSDGNRTGLNIVEFCRQAAERGLLEFDKARDAYFVAGEKTMEDFAEGMNLAMPLVQAMFGEMQEFGAEFDWADEASKTVGDLAVTATEASEALRDIKGNENLKMTIDVSGIDSLDGKVSSLNATIKEMTAYKRTLSVDSSEIEYANQIIEYCIAQKQILTAPDVMMVDTSVVEGSLGNAIAILQEFQKAKDNLERAKDLEIDTTQAQADLDAATEKVQKLDSNITSEKALNIDTTSIDSISKSISELDAELIVKAGVDESAVIGYQKEEHDANGTVEWDNDTREVDAYSAAMKYANGTVLWDNDTRYVIQTFRAKGEIDWGNSGHVGVNGTANASGTARASGDWGTATGGKTLVGELGTEIVVDPRTGRWYTVGDRGAEFVYIPKNAIVFNHLQSESLLEHGYVTGRGQSMVSGTAKTTGRALVTGYIPITNRTPGNTTNKPSSGSNSSSNNQDYYSDDISDTTRVIEEYIADIDRYNVQLKRLQNVQRERSSLEKELSNTDDLSKKIFMTGTLTSRYLEEAEAEQALMDAKRRDIAANVAELRKLGFDVDYDSGANKLLIKNLEHLNEITATTTGKYDNLMEATNDLRREIEDLISETEDLNYDNIDHAENIEDISYEIKNLKNNVIDYIEEIYDKQIDAYKKIVSERKSLLKSAKDELDYEDKVSEKVQEIAELKSKIDLISLDDSRSAQAEKNSLMQKLADLQKELANLQSDKAYSDQTEALDKLAEDYESKKKSEIETMRSVVDASDQMWGAFYQTIIGQTHDVGDAITTEIANAWRSAASAVKQYSDSVGNVGDGRSILLSDVPVYHDGGYVGATNIGDNETLAILRKGELVLTDDDQNAVSRIIDSYSILARYLSRQDSGQEEKLLSGLSLNTRGLTDRINSFPSQIVERSQSLVFEPHIEVNIEHNGSMTDGDASKYGSQIASSALDTLYDALGRRGIISTRGARLKPN